MAPPYDPFSDLEQPTTSAPAVASAPPASPLPPEESEEEIANRILSRAIQSTPGQEYLRRRRRTELLDEMRELRQPGVSADDTTGPAKRAYLGNILHLRSGDLQLEKIGLIGAGWLSRKVGFDRGAEAIDRKVDDIRQEQKEVRAAIDGLNMGVVPKITGQFGEQFVVSSPTLVIPAGAASAGVRAGLGAGAASFVGLGAGATVGGAISGLSAYDDAYQEYLDQGFDRELASEMARYPGWVAGVGTALITTAFGRTGIERSAVLNAPAQKLKAAIWQVFRDANLEGGEEMVDQFYQSILAKLTYDPNMTPEQAAVESAAAYGLGFAMGGGVEGANQYFKSRTPQEIKNDIDQNYPKPDKSQTESADERGADPNDPLAGVDVDRERIDREFPDMNPLGERVPSTETSDTNARNKWEQGSIDQRELILGADEAKRVPIPLDQVGWDSLTDAQRKKVRDFFGLPVDEAAEFAAELEAKQVEEDLRAERRAAFVPSEEVSNSLKNASEPTITVEEFVNLPTATDFANKSDEVGVGGGGTRLAYHIGQKIANKYHSGNIDEAENELQMLKNQHALNSRANREAMQAARESGDPEQMMALGERTVKNQFIREAIEAAEDTGDVTSAKDALELYPEWNPIRRGQQAEVDETTGRPTEPTVEPEQVQQAQEDQAGVPRFDHMAQTEAGWQPMFRFNGELVPGGTIESMGVQIPTDEMRKAEDSLSKSVDIGEETTSGDVTVARESQVKKSYKTEPIPTTLPEFPKEYSKKMTDDFERIARMQVFDMIAKKDLPVAEANALAKINEDVGL
ncbi:MAG: hypothetical protein ACWGQW_03550, partial [bacterium]